MTGIASPEKASSSKKKSERKCASKEEYRQLSGIMAVMNNLRKQVGYYSLCAVNVGQDCRLGDIFFRYACTRLSVYGR